MENTYQTSETQYGKKKKCKIILVIINFCGLQVRMIIHGNINLKYIIKVHFTCLIFLIWLLGNFKLRMRLKFYFCWTALVSETQQGEEGLRQGQ